MANKKNYWSDEEVQYLLDQVKVNPQNLNKAFIIVAKEINRSKNAVSYKYYSMMNKKGAKANFALVSPKKGYLNKKNISLKAEARIPQMRESKLKRIIRIIFDLDK